MRKTPLFRLFTTLLLAVTILSPPYPILFPQWERSLGRFSLRISPPT